MTARAMGGRAEGQVREKDGLGPVMRSNGVEVLHESQTLKGEEVKFFQKMNRNSM